MKTILKKIHPLFILLSMFILFSCTTFADTTSLHDNRVNIEITNATHAVIKHVTVKNSGKGIWVYGKAQRPQDVHGRTRGLHGRIPGHLDVQVFAPDGTSIYKDSLRYKRSIIIPRLTRFSFKVTDSLSEGSTIRIRPHYSVGDDNCKKKNSDCHFDQV